MSAIHTSNHTGRAKFKRRTIERATTYPRLHFEVGVYLVVHGIIDQVLLYDPITQTHSLKSGLPLTIIPASGSGNSYKPLRVLVNGVDPAIKKMSHQ